MPRTVPLLVAAFVALTASAQPPFPELESRAVALKALAVNPNLTELEILIRGLEELLRERRRRSI